MNSWPILIRCFQMRRSPKVRIMSETSKKLIDLTAHINRVQKSAPVRVKGRVTELTGIIVKAVIPGVRIGDVCMIETRSSGSQIKAEVVGFRGEEVLLMPLGAMEGIGPESEVLPMNEVLSVGVGPQLLGRVINA